MLRALLASTLAFLRESFTENLGLKALALTFALGLFAFLQGQTDEQQRTIPVPIVMRLPPESSERELMTPIPASIHVTLRGPARAIDRQIQTGIVPIEIDLRDGQAESISFDAKSLLVPARDDDHHHRSAQYRPGVGRRRDAANPTASCHHRAACRRLRGQG